MDGRVIELRLDRIDNEECDGDSGSKKVCYWFAKRTSSHTMAICRILTLSHGLRRP